MAQSATTPKPPISLFMSTFEDPPAPDALFGSSEGTHLCRTCDYRAAEADHLAQHNECFHPAPDEAPPFVLYMACTGHALDMTDMLDNMPSFNWLQCTGASGAPHGVVPPRPSHAALFEDCDLTRFAEEVVAAARKVKVRVYQVARIHDPGAIHIVRDWLVEAGVRAGTYQSIALPDDVYAGPSSARGVTVPVYIMNRRTLDPPSEHTVPPDRGPSAGAGAAAPTKKDKKKKRKGKRKTGPPAAAAAAAAAAAPPSTKEPPAAATAAAAPTTKPTAAAAPPAPPCTNPFNPPDPDWLAGSSVGAHVCRKCDYRAAEAGHLAQHNQCFHREDDAVFILYMACTGSLEGRSAIVDMTPSFRNIEGTGGQAAFADGDIAAFGKEVIAAARAANVRLFHVARLHDPGLGLVFPHGIIEAGVRAGTFQSIELPDDVRAVL